MREFGKLDENGQLGATVIADECPKGLKEVFRDAIIPEDAEIIYIEDKTSIRQTFKQD